MQCVREVQSTNLLRLRVLVLKNTSASASGLADRLASAGVDLVVRRVATLPDFLAALHPPPDVIIAGDVPGLGAVDALRLLRERGLNVPVVAVTATAAATLAAENARLARRAEQRAVRLTALSALSGVMTGAVGAERVMDAVAEAAVALFGARVAHVWIDDPATTRLHLLGSAGLTREFEAQFLDVTVLAHGEALVGQVFASGTARYVADVTQEARFANRRLAEAAGLHGYAVVPLTADGQTIGVLSLLFEERRVLDGEEQALVDVLARYAAVALRDAGLVADLRRRQVQLESLLDVSSQLSRLQPIATLLERIAEACARLLRSDIVCFRLVEGDELVTRATWSTLSGAVPEMSPTVRDGLSDLVLAGGEPLAVTRFSDDPRGEPALREVARQLGCQAWLGVPLKTGDRVVGILSSITRGPEFSASDLSIATAFASQAATALDNARLYAEAREAYERLARTQEQLVGSQKMEAIGQLTGSIAHDFNNLLTVILGRINLIRNRRGPVDQQERDLSLLQTTAERAAALTRQLLAFSRKQVLRPRVLDLNDVVAGMVPMLRPLLGEALELAILPGPGPATVSADPAQMDQVLLNLAVNARDAMTGGGRLSIATDAVVLDHGFTATHPGSREGPFVVLSVADTGSGMTVEVRQRIFEPFFTTKAAGVGTGLGLATVYGIVKQHDGYIDVESAPGRGTTFRVYLPRATGPAEASRAGPALLRRRRGAETILVVEDGREIRELVRDALERDGYAVLEAADGYGALRLAGEHQGPIHLLLADIHMPRLDGLELARRLTRVRAETRVVFMSGFASSAVLAAGESMPGPIMAKPFTADDLVSKIAEVLDAPPG